MYRGLKFYEAAVKATGGKLGREEVAAAMDVSSSRADPALAPRWCRARGIARCNMYLAGCKIEGGKPRSR
jgi:hypothetical protein